MLIFSNKTETSPGDRVASGNGHAAGKTYLEISRRLVRYFFRLRLVVFFPELIYAAFGVDQLLLAREEGVADGADIEPNVGLGRTGLERFPAGAVNLGDFVIGMNILFHVSFPPEINRIVKIIRLNLLIALAFQDVLNFSLVSPLKIS
jgi:hypothetical protein